MLFLARTLIPASGMFKASVEGEKEKKGTVSSEEVMCGPRGHLGTCYYCKFWGPTADLVTQKL